jgi:hypothetical protein
MRQDGRMLIPEEGLQIQKPDVAENEDDQIKEQ